jgi:hypothetical protein
MSSTIAILDPVYKIVKFTINNDKEIEFPVIQITDLSKVLIDNRYCSNFTSTSSLNSKFFS